MSDAEGREIWFVNRDVLVVRPAAPFIAWAQSLDEQEPLDAEAMRTASNAFLIPEFEDDEETWGWLRENCDTVFEYMLHDWSLDPDEWPADRGWETFEAWFSVEHIAMAWDLVDEPLSSEAPDPDDDEARWDA